MAVYMAAQIASSSLQTEECDSSVGMSSEREPYSITSYTEKIKYYFYSLGYF